MDSYQLNKSRLHKRVVPRVFLLPFESDSAAGWTCFAYTIRYHNFQPGTDPLQHSASEFLLLSPGLLDEEASSLCVLLKLPAFASAESTFSYCGVLHLSHQKVEIVKKFNAWLFHVALAKCGPLPKVPAEGTKNYYVVPVKSISNGSVDPSPEQLIDWGVVEVAVNSNLVYQSGSTVKAPTEPTEAETPADDGTSGHHSAPSAAAQDDGGMRLQNGTFQEHELVEDVVVTCIGNGFAYYLSGILHDLSSSSVLFPESDERKQLTYGEYYTERWNYKLQYPHQPMLRGYKLLRAGNYSRREGEAVNKWKPIVLPPEACILHLGLKGKLFRGAMRLPAILHSLEMSLVAVELRNNIGPSVSCFKVQEALTSCACEGKASYEVLEFLGDSVLSFVGGVHLFMDSPSYGIDKLNVLLHDIISNRNLYRCGLACGLPGYIFNGLLITKTWVPPGPSLEDLPQNSAVRDEPSELQDVQLVGLKTVADVVEALIALYYLQGGVKSAVKAMEWLQVPVSFPAEVPQVILAEAHEQMQARNAFNAHDIAALEDRIGYQFRCKSLLAAAFDFGDEIKSNDNGCSKGSFSFQRLKFLGDCFLEFVMMRHFVQQYPELNPKQLNDMKEAAMNNENFACIAIHHGFHNYMQKMCPLLRAQIEVYVALVRKEGGGPFGIPSQASPRVSFMLLLYKALGGVIQTLAGAMLLDSNLDYERVWKLLEPLLSPLATPETLMLHPRVQLQALCTERNLQLECQTVQLDGRAVECKVYINGTCIASSQHENASAIARRLAAMRALQSLLANSSGFDRNGSPLNDGDDHARTHGCFLFHILSVCSPNVSPKIAAKKAMSTLARPVLQLLKYFRCRM